VQRIWCLEQSSEAGAQFCFDSKTVFSEDFGPCVLRGRIHAECVGVNRVF
jgi:hypothetical protein